MNYFTEDELQCKHTGVYKMDEEFLYNLNRLREAFGKPLIVTSGYRHRTHPIEAKKSEPGAHAHGRAVDLKVKGEEAYELVRLALLSGKFTGIGVKQKGYKDKRFIHLDDMSNEDYHAPRPFLWSY